ncbi:uncharacterized protein F5147DRAFT_655496 [Suillus discolor]|uniref:Uncharacterized protein n=1 Tax=Suillus discolor TaxID=1912936 RepID=A0A9P7F1D2_9AGAM|nr:uncharacterized protein F5147DRAFT_655496 [Suillus discolor]KAG2100708.1 hypothetical protein F5147DRAFT_655496 [Suillus discolor]
MPNKTNTVSPFYDQEPDAPPPFPPMLTDQLELFGSAHHSTTLVADKILPSRISTVNPPQHIKHPQLKDTLVPSPYLKKILFSPSHSNSQIPMPSDSSGSLDSASDSGSSTLTKSLLEDLKIPKPPGEPGCLGHGGYTLCEVPKVYAKFKCASSQNHELLKVVCNKAVNAFPHLENYSGFWPLNDMIMMHLKYMSGHARQKEARMAVGKSKLKSHQK